MKRHAIKLITLSSLIFISIFANAESSKTTNNIFTGGRLYPIAEKDALEEIKQRGEKADVQGFIEKKPRENWSLWQGYPLPEATKNARRNFVPWYSLEMDIKDEKGRIIYPKGFTYNPLAYMKLPQRIVVYKIGQYDKIKKFIRESDVIIADSGDVVEEGKKVNRDIFILSEQIATRLSVKRLPSFIEQQGQALLITEVSISDL